MGTCFHCYDCMVRTEMYAKFGTIRALVGRPLITNAAPWKHTTYSGEVGQAYILLSHNIAI